MLVVMIIFSKFMVPRGYLGMTIYPFVILKHAHLKQNAVLVNHERIHLRQQLELLVLPFYFLYCFEFLIRLYQFKTWHLAYRNISFEREAYTKEKDLDYLKSRSFWSFTNYF